MSLALPAQADPAALQERARMDMSEQAATAQTAAQAAQPRQQVQAVLLMPEDS